MHHLMSVSSRRTRVWCQFRPRRRDWDCYKQWPVNTFGKLAITPNSNQQRDWNEYKDCSLHCIEWEKQKRWPLIGIFAIGSWHFDTFWQPQSVSHDTLVAGECVQLCHIQRKAGMSWSRLFQFNVEILNVSCFVFWAMHLSMRSWFLVHYCSTFKAGLNWYSFINVPLVS